MFGLGVESEVVVELFAHFEGGDAVEDGVGFGGG